MLEITGKIPNVAPGTDFSSGSICKHSFKFPNSKHSRANFQSLATRTRTMLWGCPSIQSLAVLRRRFLPEPGTQIRARQTADVWRPGTEGAVICRWQFWQHEEMGIQHFQICKNVGLKARHYRDLTCMRYRNLVETEMSTITGNMSSATQVGMWEYLCG